ncbi:SDR family oxidoreductase [Myceligenerans cantabricum]
MDLQLAGKHALVSASTSGLGLAIAVELAREGADVAICGRDPDRLDAARRQVERAATGRVLADKVDLRDDEQTRGWISATATELGGLDIAVTNTGGVPFGPVETFTLEEIRSAFDGNFFPSVNVAATALPWLRESGGGRLMFVTSEAVRQPHHGSGLSSVARLGLVGYAKGLAEAAGPDGVTVNVIAPGFHRTPILDVQYGDRVEAELAKVADSLPVRRVGDPADLGRLVAFLASGHAAYITGTVHLVDGGNSRGLG